MRNRITFFILLPGLLLTFILSGCDPFYPRSDRAGFGMSTRSNPHRWAAIFGAGWFLDWGTRRWVALDGLEYWQTIRLSQAGIRPDLDQIDRLARNNRGAVWVIGNEPDNALQDNIPAELYAAYYHAIYSRIKQVDEHARVAVGGVSQPTPLRMRYLEDVLNTYQYLYGESLPCDWWTVHAYVLREEVDSWGAGIPVGQNERAGLLIEPEQHGDLELFKQHLVDFRTWMKAMGYQNKPLAVTEFGILLPADFGYTDEVIANYLEESVRWLNEASDPSIGYAEDGDRLVQRWAWFSLADPIFPVADLADLETNDLTRVGEAYRQVIQEQLIP